MRVTAISDVRFSLCPVVDVNMHRVELEDRCMGKVIFDVQVPTMSASVYVSMSMRVQLDSMLRVGETVELGGQEFMVVSVDGGWFDICFNDRRLGRADFELLALQTKKFIT